MSRKVRRLSICVACLFERTKTVSLCCATRTSDFSSVGRKTGTFDEMSTRKQIARKAPNFCSLLSNSSSEQMLRQLFVKTTVDLLQLATLACGLFCAGVRCAQFAWRCACDSHESRFAARFVGDLSEFRLL